MGNHRPSMMEVEHFLNEISCKLHATRTENVDEGIVALPQPCVTSAFTTLQQRVILKMMTCPHLLR